MFFNQGAKSAFVLGSLQESVACSENPHLLRVVKTHEHNFGIVWLNSQKSLAACNSVIRRAIPHDSRPITWWAVFNTYRDLLEEKVVPCSTRRRDSLSENEE